jgi:hypothetical protein
VRLSRNPEKVMTPAVADPENLGYEKLYRLILDQASMSMVNPSVCPSMSVRQFVACPVICQPLRPAARTLFLQTAVFGLVSVTKARGCSLCCVHYAIQRGFRVC